MEMFADKAESSMAVTCDPASWNVLPYDTGGVCGWILRCKRGAAEGEDILCERALFTSSPHASAANATLWAELIDLEKKRLLGGGVALGDHAAACCALRCLGADVVRIKLLCQYSGKTTLSNVSKADATVYKHLVKKGLLDKSGFSAAEYGLLLAVVRLNSFHFEPGESPESEDQGLGKAMFSTTRLINHSCAPNVEFQFSWDDASKHATLRLSARSAIAQDEELNISYLSTDPQEECGLSGTRAARRGRLRQIWGFDCNCVRCDTELSMGADEDPPSRVSTPPLDGLEW
eukprot:TRINITY_DN57455_c0_g1_i1.p1 TRINITY_DN57455_c0_g1~~TRINITY_DN57455_c0_g1_i1.p1  ORF type:complete len:290 (-),score=30.59 TRINITY_DN57455_c0_g1_i1:44-913(-)